ncbi:unnamed protein product [Camellia sinensis]
MTIKEGVCTNPIFFVIFTFSFTFFFIDGLDSSLVSGITTIRPGEGISFADSLVSQGGNFTLGFFTVKQTKCSYLGIWYIKDSQLWRVWVANPNNPLNDSGVLTIDSSTRILKITSRGRTVLNISDQVAANNVTATLQDSGNFVLTDHENGDRILWESFDHPTDTLLPGMKLGFSIATGQKKNWSLTSWLSDYFPTSGAFTMNWEPSKESGQLVIYRRGERYWTSGLLRNQSQTFESIPTLSGPPIRYCYILNYISNNDEKYFTFSGLNGSLLMWMLTPNGMIHHGANSLAIGPVDFCYGYHQYDNGCVVTKLPECRSSDDKFVQKRATFLPSNARGNYDDNSSLSLSDCMERCWSNCNCVGFNVNSNGTGCITWTGKLEYQEDYANTVPIYVLVQGNSSRGERWTWIAIAVAISLLVLIFGTFCYLRMGKLRLEVEEKRREKEFLQELISSDNFNNANDGEDDGTEGHALKILSFASIVEATNNFSIENKLGQGGFGPVYKGKLQEGRVIAVKRLSTTSCQGLVEFKNELILISKLQHTNLVRVLGCCIHGEEKMLIYEFLPNNSLDTYIFGTDPAKRGLLDWTKRLNIIEGVAQGLLYLHKYSRMRVIHRDLKASNVLLDENMNAKISDFGMARIFKINETEANTKRPAGTYGYMSPEYAMLGTFSVKSDVFSFGVLILEIVSGRRNTSFYDFDNRSLNLTGYAWELWKQGTALELKDPALGDSCVTTQFLRIIHVGLLCVQEGAMDRPMMLDVISMLNNEAVVLPAPRQPAFFIGRNVPSTTISDGRRSEDCSVNDFTKSIMEARYLGIWYTNDSTSSKVWVGNRNTPIANNSGVLTIDNAGNLIITHIGGGPIELYGAQTNTNISATLLDSGNFIMTEVNNNGSNKRVLWESFDYPADTLLPGMKLGVNHQTGQNWSLTPWLGRLIPAPGTVTLEWDPSERRLIVKQGGVIHWTSGILAILLWHKVWELWNKDTVLDLMDPMLSNSCVNQQLVRCIHVGLLCVEYRAVDRPTMSDVISMLNNDKTVLSVPKKPTFVFGRDVVEKELHKCKSEKHWRLSSTTMDGR